MDNNFTSLKQYIEAFQEGNTEVLYDLISYEMRNEKNEDGKIDRITRLNFKDSALNKIFYNMLLKYHLISRQDIESWVYSCLYGDVEGRGILYQANVKKFDDSQLISWVAKRIDGHIKNMIKKERLFDEKTIQEGRVDEDGEIGSYYDDAAFSEWNTIESNDSVYGDFLELSGGLENLLSKKQYEVFLLLHSNTQEEVAKLLDVTQSDISQTYQAMTKRIKKAYLSFKTYQIIASDKASTLTKIKRFKKNYEDIIQFDINDKFDYYGYVVKWLQENSDPKDYMDDYDAMQRNKPTYSLSVIDILMENIKENDRKLFAKVLNKSVIGNEEIILSSREKDKVALGVIGAFNKYEKEVENSIEDMNDKLINDVSEDRYEDVIKLFTA